MNLVSSDDLFFMPTGPNLQFAADGVYNWSHSIFVHKSSIFQRLDKMLSKEGTSPVTLAALARLSVQALNGNVYWKDALVFAGQSHAQKRFALFFTFER
jgi:hypothetical protein